MIYVIRCEATGLRKIGMTNDPRERMKQLQVGSAGKLVLEFVAAGARLEELRLHEIFASKRVHSEWFAVSSEDVLAQTWAGFAPPAAPEPRRAAETYTPAVERAPSPISPPWDPTPLRQQFVGLEAKALESLDRLAGSSDPQVSEESARALQRYKMRRIGRELAAIESFIEKQRAAVAS